MLDAFSTTRETAVAEEQRFLDAAAAQRDRLAGHLAAELAEPATDAAEQSRRRALRRQYDELRRAGDGLIFGRLDGADGTVRHVGRLGIRATEQDADPLVLDWRAPAARAFYTATPVDPQGYSRRRHVRTDGSTVVGVADEPLDGQVAGELVGEGALLAALDQRRTGQMSTAISTLQREQDAIIRAGASGPLRRGNQTSATSRVAPAPARPWSRCTAWPTCSTHTRRWPSRRSWSSVRRPDS